MKELEYHPASNLFPMLEGEELQQLIEDIKTNGLFEPIALYEGKILDGRNRYAACKLAGVEPKSIALNGDFDSPYLYVVSKNLRRRHLSISQQQTIGAKMADYLAQELKQRKDKAIASPPLGGNSHAAKEIQLAAHAVGVGTTSIGRARYVMHNDPEAFKQIETNKISVTRAYNQIKKKKPVSPAEPRHGVRRNKTAPYNPETAKQKQFANAEKKRMVTALSTIRGLCRGLENLDVPMVTSVSEKEEMHQWSTIAKELAHTLRGLAAKLENGK